ncbi:lantibiotic dehydratase [Lentzea sp. NPDC051213]|uniref:lantibiotic dehydratase n=1 Tax=Lentzea sp. NPDC051213 TaxID=3364126 RepID=UPI003787DBB7
MTRRWQIGKHFVLRHAGMPFDWLEDLGAQPELLRLADEVLDREAEVREAHGSSSALLRGRPAQLPQTPVVKQWAQAFERFNAAYQEADDAASERLREILARPEVSEAIFLSNPDAYHNMLRPWLAHRGTTTSKWRRVRRQMYTYVQRFCAKNETVSFFGPMAYGAKGERTELRTDLDRGRQVFFSHWAAKAVATAIARDPKILPDLTFHATGRTAAPAAVLALVTAGGRTFREIHAASDLPAGQVAKALMALIASEAVCIELGGGEYDHDPLATIVRQLGELPASAAREKWLDRVESLRHHTADLAGQDLDGKAKTVAALEELFTEVTGKPARRGAGAAYADRAVFFEECASPFALTVSAELLAQWEAVISDALEACVAHGNATQQVAIEAVRQQYGTTEIDFLDYAEQAAAALAAATSTQQATYAPTYPATELDRLVSDAEALPGDRYAVIDLCPAAPDVDGLSDAALVLSRVHHHLLVESWLATMHPDPAEYGADAAEWIAEQDGRLVGLDFGRRNKGYYRFPGREVAMRPLTWTDVVGEQIQRSWEMQVSVSADGVELRDPQGTPVQTYIALSDFVKYPPMAALSHPQVLHPSFTTDGEVAANDVVIQRARRQVATEALAAPEPHVRFLQLRRMARESGGRFVFCRSANERKPYLIDLASPLAADLIGHVARGVDLLGVERMAPEPERLWLKDEQGRRYTSELRMQVIGRSAS